MNYRRIIASIGMLSIAHAAYGGFTFFDESSVIVVNQTGVLNNQSPPGSTIIDTGKLLLTNGNNLIGNRIAFNNGILSDGNYEVVLTAGYDPNTTYSIQMTSPSRFRATVPGTIYERVRVDGTNNRMQGLPTFGSPNAITFGAPTSQLKIAIQSELNQNAVLASTLFLDASLTLGDDVTITGSGTINFNNNNLNLGPKDLIWTNTLLMLNAKNLELNSKNKVYGQWIFKNDAQIVGNNYVLDLSSGATIRVNPNTTLRLSNIIVNGLGSGRILLDGLSARLELFNAVIAMNGNYTVTTGIWSVVGETTVVTGNNFLEFDQRGTLTVDQTTLIYDNLGFLDRNNIDLHVIRTSPEVGPNYALVNGGSIRKQRSLPLGDYIISKDTTLDTEVIISPLRKLIVSQDALIDGGGFHYNFSRNPGETVVTLDPGTRTQFRNVLLDGFPLENLAQASNAQLVFGGSSTTVILRENGILNNTWMFTGTAVLDGSGKILELGPLGRLVVRPGSSLLIDNITIRGINGSKISCMDNTSTLSIGTTTWAFDDLFTFTNSSFNVIGTWDLVGTQTFVYRSSRPSVITRFGTLNLDSGMAFSYDPPIANRDLIVMENNESIFSMDNSTLITTQTGMRLTNGLLLINRQCTLLNDGGVADSQAFMFGNGILANDLTVQIGASATLTVSTGKLVYNNQS